MENSTEILSVPPELKELLPQFVKKLCKIPDCSNLIYSNNVSAVFQSVIFVLDAMGEENELKTVVSHLIKNGFEPVLEQEVDKSSISSIFESQATCHLLEIILPAAKAKYQRKLFKHLFQKQMHHLVSNQTANFTVQRLCSSWKDQQSFEKVFNAVSKCVLDSGKIECAGILLSLAQSCKRLDTCTPDFLMFLRKLLQCFKLRSGEDQIAFHLLYLTSYGYDKTATTPVSYHGSLLLQELFSFNNTNQIAKSILQLESTELSKMACDKSGSHIVDAFIKSKSIDQITKCEFVDRFKDEEMQLACSKNGSRSLERLWRVANANQKLKIGSRLLKNETKLRSGMFGEIIYHKLKLNFYKESQDRSSWEDKYNREAKKRKVLEDMQQDAMGVTMHKKRKEH